MTDINEWNLGYTPKYGGVVSYDFGHSSNDSPFTVQADISDPSRSTVDTQHGTDNAELMGRDLLGGLDLTFTLTTLPDPTGSGLVLNALDKVSQFAGAWRAAGVMDVPGKYCVLTNKLRNRFVIGRPRQFSPKHARLRKGQSEYVAIFHTISPDFYQNPQRVVAPLSAVNLNADIGGSVPAWPIVTFTGPFSVASLQWVPPVGYGSSWTLTITHAVAGADTVVVDTRPWARVAKDSAGNMQNGWLTGAKMGDCHLVPSTGGHFLFTRSGGAGTCQVAWYDAHAGL